MTAHEGGFDNSSATTNGANGTDTETSPMPALWITGLGSQYPPYVLTPDDIERFARRFYDTEKPG